MADKKDYGIYSSQNKELLNTVRRITGRVPPLDMYPMPPKSNLPGAKYEDRAAPEYPGDPGADYVGPMGLGKEGVYVPGIRDFMPGTTPYGMETQAEDIEKFLRNLLKIPKPKRVKPGTPKYPGAV